MGPSVLGSSSHATSFAILMTTVCPFCGATRSGFFTAPLEFSGAVWILMAFVVLTYSPFIYCHFSDRRDWKPVWSNQGRYFLPPWKRRRRTMGLLDRTPSGRLGRRLERKLPLPSVITMFHFDVSEPAERCSEEVPESTHS